RRDPEPLQRCGSESATFLTPVSARGERLGAGGDDQRSPAHRADGGVSGDAERNGNHCTTHVRHVAPMDERDEYDDVQYDDHHDDATAGATSAPDPATNNAAATKGLIDAERSSIRRSPGGLAQWSCTTSRGR